MTGARALVPLAPGDRALDVVATAWLGAGRRLVSPRGDVAVLRPSTWSGRAELRRVGASWRLTRMKGVLHPRIEVAGDDVSLLELDGWGRARGHVRLGAREYALEGTGLLRRSWTWRRDGELLLRLQPVGSLGLLRGRVALTARGAEDPCALLLAGLALHLQAQREAQS